MNMEYPSLPKITVAYHRPPETLDQPSLICSTDVYNLFKSVWNPNTIDLFEEFKVIYTDRKNKLLGYRNLSRGTTSGTLVNVKLLVGIALECNAEGIFLCHNHPSGTTKPSQSDIQITKKVKHACQLFDLSLLDHIILTNNHYISFCDEGWL